jgi:two-component system sensor kinase FixL
MTTAELRPTDSLVERLQDQSNDLARAYRLSLQDTLFTNRSEVRPNMLARIAASEVESLLSYFEQPQPALAVEHGAHLCQLGLSEQAVLSLGQTAHTFILTHIDLAQMAKALLTADAFQFGVTEGYIQTREKVILSEQERIRSALQRTLARYTVQMELAAGIAAATTSILDPDDLFLAAVEQIRNRFDLYYAGIFLVDETGRWAVLRAGSGEVGQTMLRLGYKVQVGSDTLIGQCTALGETQSALGIAKSTSRADHPYLPDTQSEVAIPLMVRQKVTGAISVHSQRVAAFADQDVTILRILANQLANAIENARLFAELRQSEERYRTILENIEEGYYETDLNGVVTFVNDSTSAILGYPRSEIEGRQYWSFSVPGQGHWVAATFNQVRNSGEAAKGLEFEIVCKDDSGRFVETSVTLLRDSTGQPAGFRGVIRDATRRKQAEQLAIERKALERSNRELEQFAYVASHDLQEPLRKIQTFGDRLKTKHERQLGEEGRDYLARMLNAAERMQSLINDLLMLSRVSTTAQQFVAVDLTRVAREVIFDLETSIEASAGRVDVSELVTLEADALQMRQLFQNLIGNALKFHRPDVSPVIKVSGGYLRIRRPTGPLAHDGYYRIVVEDNGIGFDLKHAERIFQLFQRLHGRNSYEGTGIGLSICQRIAERHGGKISAQSVPGQGSTFTVTLPLRHADGQDMP